MLMSTLFGIDSYMLQRQRPFLPRQHECDEVWDCLSVMEPTGIVTEECNTDIFNDSM